MTEELKPCAHCNHSVEFVYDKYADININNPEPFGKIHCIGCGIQTGDLMTFDEAIAAWNTRHCTVLDETSKDPVCLQIIPTEALKAELNRRDEYNESGELPEWLIQRINKRIERTKANKKSFDKNHLDREAAHCETAIFELQWIIDQKNPEDKE